jgi:hypothetical protein
MAFPAAAGLQPGQVTDLARAASIEVAAAERAILDQEPKQARIALGRAESSLIQLQKDAPGSGTSRRLLDAENRLRRGESTGVKLGPLVDEVDRFTGVSAPEVLERTQSAQRSLEGGRRGGRDEAARQLGVARERLNSDLGLSRVEEVWSRVTAARVALERGDVGSAQEVLGPVPAALDQTGVKVALVPIRQQLEQATVAAQRGDAAKVRQGLDSVVAQLRAAEDSAEESTARALRPLLEQTESLKQKTAQNRPVRPKDVRALAQAAEDIGRG